MLCIFSTPPVRSAILIKYYKVSTHRTYLDISFNTAVPTPGLGTAGRPWTHRFIAAVLLNHIRTAVPTTGLATAGRPVNHRFILTVNLNAGTEDAAATALAGHR